MPVAYQLHRLHRDSLACHVDAEHHSRARRRCISSSAASSSPVDGRVDRDGALVFSLYPRHPCRRSQRLRTSLTMTMLLGAGRRTVGIIAAYRYQSSPRLGMSAASSAQSILQHHLSFRDHLTGCFNRRYGGRTPARAGLERASRYPAWPTAVIMCATSTTSNR